MTAATISIVDGQRGAKRSELTAIRDHSRQTSTKKDIEPSLDVLRSSLDESHGVSEEVGGCSCGTNHLCSDGCGPCSRRHTGSTKSPKGARTQDDPAYGQTRTGLKSHVSVSEQPCVGVPLRMSWGDAKPLGSISCVGYSLQQGGVADRHVCHIYKASSDYLLLRARSSREPSQLCFTRSA